MMPAILCSSSAPPCHLTLLYETKRPAATAVLKDGDSSELQSCHALLKVPKAQVDEEEAPSASEQKKWKRNEIYLGPSTQHPPQQQRRRGEGSALPCQYFIKHPRSIDAIMLSHPVFRVPHPRSLFSCLVIIPWLSSSSESTLERVPLGILMESTWVVSGPVPAPSYVRDPLLSLGLLCFIRFQS